MLGLSVAMGLEKMNPRTFVIVISISLGVALASYGELNLCVSNLILSQVQTKSVDWFKIASPAFSVDLSVKR